MGGRVGNADYHGDNKDGRSMRLVINLSGTDLFIQGEWNDNAGVHSRRITEDLPANIRKLAADLIAWCNDYEVTTLAPKTSKDAELQALNYSRQKIADRIKDLERN